MGNYQSAGYYLPTAGFYLPDKDEFYKSAVEGPEYNYNPNYNQERLHSDYTGFYVGIIFCVVVAFFLLVVNLVLGCCSPWKKYWTNWHSGNRVILPLFITPPKDQEPILI